MLLLPLHHAHDYRALMARWRALALRVGVKLKTLTTVEGMKIHWLETLGAGEAAVYLSSGVHGDEVGAAWGLLIWAEENEALLKQRRFLIFPCLNPHGLMKNTRVDHRGLDINRRFHLDDDEVCGPWLKLMRGRSVSVGMCLHEDYDGQGCYVYELSYQKSAFCQPIMAGMKTLPPDPRRSIDGSKSNSGVIRRRKLPVNLAGLPEAILLYQMGCELTLTFETPSEFSLDLRVQAQVEFVNAVLSQR